MDFGTVKAGVENRLVHLMETNFKACAQLGLLAWPLDTLPRLGAIQNANDFDEMVAILAGKRMKVQLWHIE